ARFAPGPPRPGGPATDGGAGAGRAGRRDGDAVRGRTVRVGGAAVRAGPVQYRPVAGSVAVPALRGPVTGRERTAGPVPGRADAERTRLGNGRLVRHSDRSGTPE